MEPSGSVKLTISLYFGNLTWLACQHSIKSGGGDAKQQEDTNILEDDEGTIDTANSIVLEVRRHPIGGGWLSWVAHC